MLAKTRAQRNSSAIAADNCRDTWREIMNVRHKVSRNRNASGPAILNLQGAELGKQQRQGALKMREVRRLSRGGEVASTSQQKASCRILAEVQQQALSGGYRFPSPQNYPRGLVTQRPGRNDEAVRSQ